MVAAGLSSQLQLLIIININASWPQPLFYGDKKNTGKSSTAGET